MPDRFSGECEEPKRLYECDECEDGIYEGEDYYNDGGFNYCEECARIPMSSYSEKQTAHDEENI